MLVGYPVWLGQAETKCVAQIRSEFRATGNPAERSDWRAVVSVTSECKRRASAVVA